MNQTIKSFEDNLKQEEENRERKTREKIAQANKAYAEILLFFLALLQKNKLDPNRVHQYITTIEAAMKEEQDKLKTRLIPPFKEPGSHPGCSSRIDGLEESKCGGFTLASFIRRVKHILVYLERKSPGVAPDFKQPPAHTPVRRVVEAAPPRAVVKEELPDKLGDTVEIKLPPRKRGAETAAMRKLREAQEKRS